MSDWLKVAIERQYLTLFKHDSFQNWKRIGKGGFGTVYSAYSIDIENTVALKILHYDKDDSSLNNFIQEVCYIILSTFLFMFLSTSLFVSLRVLLYHIL